SVSSHSPSTPQSSRLSLQTLFRSRCRPCSADGDRQRLPERSALLPPRPGVPAVGQEARGRPGRRVLPEASRLCPAEGSVAAPGEDRKSTRLNSSHVSISYAVFCLK